MLLIRSAKLGLWLGAALVMAPGVMVPGDPVHAATVAGRDDRAETCAKIAELLEPQEVLQANVDKVAVTIAASIFGKSPNLAALDAKYPGLQQAIATSLVPVMRRNIDKGGPQLRADVANLYASNLTSAEARNYMRFLLTPEMQAFARAVHANVSVKTLINDAANNADHKISPGEIHGNLRNAGVKAAGQSSMQQRMVIGMFFNSPTGKKVTALGPQKFAIEAKWANYSTPGTAEEFKHAMQMAMVAHIAKTDPATAGSMRTAMGANSAPLPAEQPAPQPTPDTIVVPAPSAPAPTESPKP